jgi:hypothetical protein
LIIQPDCKTNMKTRRTHIAIEYYSVTTTPNSIALEINSNKTGGIRRWYFSTLIAIIFMLRSFAVTAATYYIAPNGSNAANGSMTTPWQTLMYACTHATTPGDTIFVKAGTYNETARCNLAVGVSIRGEGVTSIIKSSYVASHADYGVICLNSAVGNPVNGNQSVSYLKIDGNALTTPRGIAVNFRNNVEIHHCTFVDFNYSAIRFKGNNKGYPNPPTVIYSSGNSIHDCVFINNSSTPSHDAQTSSIIILGQDGFLIYNNTMNNTARAVGLNGKHIGGNWVKGLKIHDNVFTKNDQELTEWNFVFEIWHWQGGGEIFNNTFNGAAPLDLCDVRKGTYDYGIKIYNNRFLVAANTTYNTSHMIQAIDLEDHGAIQYCYVYNNYFKNVPGGIQIVGLVDETDTVVNIDHIYIYSNVFENVGSTDVNWGFPICLTATAGGNNNIVWDQISIYNNTLTSYLAHKTFAGIYWNVGGKVTNATIRNNIIQGFATYPVSFVLGLAGSTINNLSIENNLFYDNDSANRADFGTLTIANKTAKNNKIGNPLFVSSPGFHLKAGSPAIDAGIDVGLPYKGSAPDMGAFESK